MKRNEIIVSEQTTETLMLMEFCFEQNDMTTVHLRWTDLLMPLLQKYKLNITWGDQDLLNIIFHYNPGTF